MYDHKKQVNIMMAIIVVAFVIAACWAGWYMPHLVYALWR